MLVRILSVEGFGAFALAYAAYLFALGMARALCLEPLMIRYSAAHAGEQRAAAAACTWISLVVGVTSAVILLALTPLLPPIMRPSMVALAITAPGLLLQDAWRYAFFTSGRPKLAAINDGAWAILLLGSLTTALLLDITISPSRAVLLWGGSAGLAAIFGAAQARHGPRARGAVLWMRTAWDLSRFFVAEYVANAGAGHLVLFALGGLYGLGTVGALRAGQVLFGPLNVLFMASAAIAIPEGVRVLAVNPPRLFFLARRFALALMGASLAWGTLLLAVDHFHIGVAILGETWHATAPLILPLTIATAGSGVALATGSALRVLGRARATLGIRLTNTPAVAGFPILGAGLGGAAGAGLGLALASWTGAAMWAGVLARTRRKLMSAPSDAQSSNGPST